MNYLQINDIYCEDSSSDNSVVIVNSENSEEIEDESAADYSAGTEDQSAADSETSEEPAEETSEEPAEETSEEPAEETSEEPADVSSEEPAETNSVITVSLDSLSYNGITPPMYYESFTILVFLLAAILGVALFNIFRSKL